jgi:hypothetical protein
MLSAHPRDLNQRRYQSKELKGTKLMCYYVIMFTYEFEWQYLPLFDLTGSFIS